MTNMQSFAMQLDTMPSHVFVSSDFKYFKVSHVDCLRSPCLEIIQLVSHVNVTSFPIYLITPLTGAAIAVAFATGSIPFEMTIKSLDETMKLFQNIQTYQDIMQSVSDVANALVYQQLFRFYAQQFSPAPLVSTTTKESHANDSVNEDVSVYIIDDEDDNQVSKNKEDMIGGFEFYDVDENEGMDTDIDTFLEELCNNNDLLELQL
jgi:hypothetical protein